IRDGHVTGVQTCALPICELLDEPWIDIRDVGQSAGLTREEERADVPADRNVLRAPEPEERRILEVVAAGQPRVGQAIPDGWERRSEERRVGKSEEARGGW